MIRGSCTTGLGLVIAAMCVASPAMADLAMLGTDHHQGVPSMPEALAESASAPGFGMNDSVGGPSAVGGPWHVSLIDALTPSTILEGVDKHTQPPAPIPPILSDKDFGPRVRPQLPELSRPSPSTREVGPLPASEFAGDLVLPSRSPGLRHDDSPSKILPPTAPVPGATLLGALGLGCVSLIRRR